MDSGDSSAEDRRRRLELLLLTDLDAFDYWHASRRWHGGLAAAAGATSALRLRALDGRLGVSGRASLPQESLRRCRPRLNLWCFSFVLGFLAFSKGRQDQRPGRPC